MPRLSAFVKELKNRAAAIYRKVKSNWARYAGLLFVCLYGYGMLVNLLARGFRKTEGSAIEWSPFTNISAVFSPTGLGIAFVSVVFYVLFTRKGLNFISGYKTVVDKERKLEILPEGTHGTSSWMDRKRLASCLVKGPVEDLTDVLLGELPDAPGSYVAYRPQHGMNRNIMIYGAPGTGKSRGVYSPYILNCIRSGESIVLADCKAEFYEQYSEILRDEGYTVKVFNLLDMNASDAWNSMAEAEDVDLVRAVAEIIIKNTSNADERNNFWEKSEKDLLQALYHYVQSMTVIGTRELLPIHDRSLGAIYRLIAETNTYDLESRFNDLKRDNPRHPALAPFGIFKKANKQLWGNIMTGLGNRLSVFQNEDVDNITRFNEIDLELPGKQKCAYFCILSDQDSSLEFLSSLFFSLLFIKLSDYARRQPGRRLPVPVNVLMDELCNIGKLMDFKRLLSVSRSKAINIVSATQSIAQLADRYPKTEWMELVGNCDVQIFLGTNDTVMTADFISKSCGNMTVRVNDATVPMMPFLVPSRISARPYTQKRGSTSRPLLMPDEVLRFPRDKALILIRGEKPLRLNKLNPEQLPAYARLRTVKADEHIPLWRQEETAIRHTEIIPPADSEQEPDFIDLDDLPDIPDFDELPVPEPQPAAPPKKRAPKRNEDQMDLFHISHPPVVPSSGGIDLAKPLQEIDGKDI